MSNSTTNSPALRATKTLVTTKPEGGGPRINTGMREMPNTYGAQIAQAALRSIGTSVRNPGGPLTGRPEYALAVSTIFTKATNQTIMLGTPPHHVLSRSHLWNSLLHDNRFKQVTMSEAAPGDIIIEPGFQNGASGYASIVVDHGRIVSDSSRGIEDNSSLIEVQRNHPSILLFRYIGIQARRGHAFVNANFNSDESRVPAGQNGGGQWTREIAPSTLVLSGGNNWTSVKAGSSSQKTDTKSKAKESPQAASQQETYITLLAKVFQAIDSGGKHPTFAQMRDFDAACDAWKNYVVSQGASPFVANEQLENIVRNYNNPGSGPNAGSEGVLGFQQGQTAGAGAGGIVGQAAVGVSTSQKDSVWSMGPGPRGLEIESRLGGNLPPGFPKIDHFENGVAKSIKSIDLNTPSLTKTQAN